ncbi:hypothetical protein [Paucisalibacillus sp. EB02]|uniref:hypothetical protein n=1 Tax=Paucisalibacillus sp. EB02 TaxID=1347087 RepID=UPI0004AD49F4|nr:hypothetical protein [Paucisalibacillus sp. EB02]
MLKEEKSNSTPSSNQKDFNKSPKDLNGIKKLKSFDINTSAGFVCDINTGICSPVEQKKEGKE